MDEPNSQKQNDRAYWAEQCQSVQDANTLFFAWFDAVRLRCYPPEDGLSLEIGPGNGFFSKEAGVDVLVDISYNLLVNLNRDSCMAVVADAVALPFKQGVFRRVYTNDVLHHLKEQDGLQKAACEIKAVLQQGGTWCVSERLPSLYNTAILGLNALARSIYKAILRILSREIALSGSDDEPPMTRDDFAALEQGLTIRVATRWRNVFVFWCYGGFQFLRLALPHNQESNVARFLISMIKGLEAVSPGFLKNDICLVLEKKGM